MGKKQDVGPIAVTSGMAVSRREGSAGRRVAAKSTAVAAAPGGGPKARTSSAEPAVPVRPAKAPAAKASGKPVAKSQGASPAKSPARPSASRSPLPAVAATAPAMPSVDPAHARHTAIAEAAYLLALQRGFEAGHELDDWLQAEASYAVRAARG